MSKIDFMEVRFPSDIACGAITELCYRTDITTTACGFEYRNTRWNLPKLRFQVLKTVKERKKMEDLIKFFRVCHGKAIGFRFKDWSDYTGEKQFIGTGNNHEKEYQLVKWYHIEGYEKKRIITKPVAGTVKVYSDSGELIKHSLDATTGLITLHIAPVTGTKVFADFQFDVPVRFDTDTLQCTIEGKDLYLCGDLNLMEIKR